MSQENRSMETPTYAWVIVVVVYLASFAQAMMLNKVPPMIPILKDAFDVSLGTTGLLLSVFGLTSFILALPAGMITQRLGLKTTGSMALGLLVLGGLLGAVTDNFWVLMFSRILEGVGAAMLFVVTPAAIAMWFPPEKTGAPMGVYSTSIPIASFVIMALAPALEPSIGWKGVWWLTAGCCLVGLIVYWFFMRPALVSEGEYVPGRPENPSPLKEVLGNRNLLLLTLGILTFGLTMMPVMTYYPTYLNEVAGMTLTKAGMMAGLIGIIAIPVSPLAGLISDRIGSRKKVGIAGFVFLLIGLPIAFKVSGEMVWVVVVLGGLVVGIITPIFMAAVPDALDDVELVPLGMAALVMGVNLGLVVGPPIFGALVEKVGWANSAFIYTPGALLGIVFTAMYQEERG
jgi:predicted MFS family arabinose efflux permease